MHRIKHTQCIQHPQRSQRKLYGQHSQHSERRRYFQRIGIALYSQHSERRRYFQRIGIAQYLPLSERARHALRTPLFERFQHTQGIVAALMLSCALAGCIVQEQNGAEADEPLNDAPSLAVEGAVLGDDGLIAPGSPTLSIGSAPGALVFNWIDQHNNGHGNGNGNESINRNDSNNDGNDGNDGNDDNDGTITQIKLYQYNYRTEEEQAIDTDIDTGAQQFTLAITPHRLAWDSLSYRVEICTVANCLSSQRMPIKGLLTDSVTAISSPAGTEPSPSFGDAVALNASGNLAVVSNPLQSRVSVFFHLDQQWVHASTLSSVHFSSHRDTSLRVAVSASGDTIAVATVSRLGAPVIVIFDRLGENWIETASIVVSPSSNGLSQWDEAATLVQLSDNGDRLLFGTRHSNQSLNELDNLNNALLVFDRHSIDWTLTQHLIVPAQHTRLPSFSADASITHVLSLSALNNALYVHEYSFNGTQWQQSPSQFLPNISPSIDTKIVSATDKATFAIAAWEQTDSSVRTPVAWQFGYNAAGWIAQDSVRLPPVSKVHARLRLGADATLTTIAIGWQASSDANLAFYEKNNLRWVNLFSVPAGFNLNRAVPLVQSLAISRDNSTALIGTPFTGNGGVVSSFR